MVKTWSALVFSLLVATAACKHKPDAKGSAATGGSAAAPAASGLAWQPDSMAHDSPACKKALACCEATVKAEKPSAAAADYNEHCSGVALAATDNDCDQFLQGYVAELGANKQPPPAECK